MIVIGFLLCCYILILVVLVYLGRAMPRPPANEVDPPSVSVVIPFRNEAENLKNLVKAIDDLTFAPERCEVIFVDDHSTDGGAHGLAAQLPERAQLIQLAADEHGKKAALAAGIERAQGSIIVTTDADCVMSPDWLQAVVTPFANPAVQLATGEVIISVSNFFSACQHVEFSTVMVLTRAAIRAGKPILCNGANLAFRKSAYQQVGGYASHRHVASGDDEFLMRQILDQFGQGSVAWHHGVVETKAQPGVAAFFRQRLRWASKWRHNTSVISRWAAVLTLGVQALLLALLFSIAWLGIPGLVLVASKTVADVVFLLAIRPGRSHVLASLVVSLVYPLYVVLVAVAGQIVMPPSWKDRTQA